MANYKEVEIIIKNPRARQNMCTGFCIDCPQAKVHYETRGSESEKNRIDYFFYSCDFPPNHSYMEKPLIIKGKPYNRFLGSIQLRKPMKTVKKD